mmetsp:Transcript_78324/g.211934  ORF Transcript_78324/g.211934 Transcript_78324/m.211934 type:complete len:209 (+) Transcript_78324:157-783(+)
MIQNAAAMSELAQLVPNLYVDELPARRQRALHFQQTLHDELVALHGLVAREMNRLQLALGALCQGPLHAADDRLADAARQSQHLEGGVRHEHLPDGLSGQQVAVQPEGGEAPVAPQGLGKNASRLKPHVVLRQSRPVARVKITPYLAVLLPAPLLSQGIELGIPRKLNQHFKLRGRAIQLRDVLKQSPAQAVVALCIHEKIIRDPQVA